MRNSELYWMKYWFGLLRDFFKWLKHLWGKTLVVVFFNDEEKNSEATSCGGRSHNEDKVLEKLFEFI